VAAVALVEAVVPEAGPAYAVEGVEGEIQDEWVHKRQAVLASAYVMGTHAA
jgi:hypothetical protein